MDALYKDRAPPGMTSLEWCHIQTQHPILSQIMREINNKSLGKMKIKVGMPSELKALIKNRTQLILKHGVLYKKARVNARTKELLVYLNHTDKEQLRDVMTKLDIWVRIGCWIY